MAFILPSFLSIVTPGQFPTFCELPVSLLNKVVFPQFGLPARAMTRLNSVPPSIAHAVSYL